jgi:hypothetical protein
MNKGHVVFLEIPLDQPEQAKRSLLELYPDAAQNYFRYYIAVTNTAPTPLGEEKFQLNMVIPFQ